MDWDEKRRIEKIRAFLFDIGGVLGLNVPRYFIRELAVRQGKDEKETARAFLLNWDEFLKGKITEEKFYEEMLLEIGIGKDHKKNIEECKEIARSCLSLDAEAVETVKKLQEAKKRDYPKEEFIYGIISNTTREWKEYLEKMHPEFFRLFNKKYLSCELNAKKADALKRIIEDIGIKPENILIVDDNQANIDAARKLGIRSLKVKSGAEMKQEFQKMELLGGE